MEERRRGAAVPRGRAGLGNGQEEEDLEPLLRNIEPPAEVTNIDKAMMAKEEGNDFFRVKTTNSPSSNTRRLSACAPEKGYSTVRAGTGRTQTDWRYSLAIALPPSS